VDDLQARLWKAANKLRGQVDAAAYKHVVLALLFLRFLDRPGCPLACPEEARWDALRAGRLDRALAAVERSNPGLAGALPRGLDGLRRMDELLALLSGLDAGGGRDALGEVYEYFLGRFARAEGRRGGQFYTPRSVVRLLKEMLALRPDETVYDPCCGSGGMFLAGGGVGRAVGQESNASTWRLARQGLALHGIAGDLGPRAADSFLEDLHPRLRAPVVLANPPFNQSDWGGAALRDDPRWRCGRPPDGNANFAWLQHVLHHLAPDGRAAVVLANGALGTAQAGQAAIRRALVEEGFVDAIVALPPRLFFSTSIPASVWILSRARPGTTLFLDARERGAPVGRSLRALTPADIADLAALYEAYRGGGGGDRPGLAAVATTAEIAAKGFTLSPPRYVAPPAGPGRDAARERVRRLAAEWKALAHESDRLGREIEEADLGV